VIERSRVRLPPLHFRVAYTTRSTQPFIRVGKSSIGLPAGIKAGRVHLSRVAGNTVILYGW